MYLITSTICSNDKDPSTSNMLTNKLKFNKIE